MLKKTIRILILIFIGLTGILLASPYIFKNEIISIVKSQINKNINSRVDFSDLDISFIRNFPNVSIDLNDLLIIGSNEFSTDTLLFAKKLGAAVEILSFFRGENMSVNNIYLKSPRVHALVNKQGLANWDIMKPTEAPSDTTAAKPFNLELKKYSIEDGYVLYDDRESDMSLEIKNLNHSGSGDFTADLFTLNTTTEADEVSFTYGLIPYLSRVRTTLSSDIKVDNKNSTYSFEKLDALLNALKIEGKGSIKSMSNAYGMDLSFKSPSTDFKDILSLVPVIYTTDFDEVTASGKANFEGNIKGIYSESSMPGYHFAMSVKDGSFKYSDLPKAVQQINFNLLVDNPDGITDHTIVDIKNGHLAIDNEPFDFRLLLKNPVTNMFIDAAAKGKLDLSQVASFAKLDKGTSLAGFLKADVNIKGNVNDIENQRFDRFYSGGTIDVNKFNYTSPDYPTVIKINNLNTIFTPIKINIANLDGEYMKSAFNGDGQINNLLSYLLLGKHLSADLSLNVDRVNLNDWMGVSSDPVATETVSEPFIVPDYINVNLKTKVNQLKYDNLEITNLAGDLKVADETIILNDVNGRALDGTIGIKGSYSTKNSKSNPAIALGYTVSQVDIQKTFYAFNTVQKLMPIGKYMGGKLTSELFANGSLGKNMSIDMNTLSGKGNVFLIEGLLSKFAPLDKIASTLNIKALEQISLKDIKAIFEFTNGKVLVKPFTVKTNDIEMEIGGMQGIDQSLNYIINMKLPRSLMGSQGNQLVNNLATSVSSKGIPVNLGETVNLKMGLAGTILKPELKVDLKQSGESLAAQMEQQAKDFAQAKIDSSKAIAKDTLNSIKKQLAAAAKDQLQKQISGNKDSTTSGDKNVSTNNATKNATESAKGLINNLFKKKQKDTANNQ
jgi:AsmA-like C-terminal region